MLKMISVEFPDGFVPPDEFIWERCNESGCPFAIYDTYQEQFETCYCNLAHMVKGNECPIRQYFNNDK